MSGHFETIGIDPRGYRLMVRVREVEKQTEGGLILVEETLKKEEAVEMRGVVIAMGPDCYHDKPSVYCAVGDDIIFAKYAGLKYTGADGNEYRILNDEDVVAVLNSQLVKEGRL